MLRPRIAVVSLDGSPRGSSAPRADGAASGYAYVGTELDVFARAERWKAYYGSFLRPFLSGDVLEVGAGLGATARALCDGTSRSWLCLEPDPSLAASIAESLRTGALPACCRVLPGDLSALPEDALFDTILYIDVLEHIEKDADELLRASRHLRPGARLAVVAPAHPWLYTPFDRAIGHFRRYTRRSLSDCAPPRLLRERLLYLDSAGLLLSLGNRLLLRSAHPTDVQIQFWDRAVVPVSRLLDPLLRNRVGKTLVGIWRRDAVDTITPTA
jgi:SAM-dependent methyltransferase